MRILIIAGGRTGGKRFSEWLSMETKHYLVHEPFYDWNNEKRDFNKDNIIVKVLVNEYLELAPPNFINTFDKVIGLIRTDTKDTAISQTYGILNNTWQEKYNISNEWINMNKDFIEVNEQMIIETNKTLNKIEGVGLRVTYEGLYYQKEAGHSYCKDVERVMNFLELKELKYSHWIDNIYRYRNNNHKLNLL
jgi:hypothetical protein